MSATSEADRLTASRRQRARHGVELEVEALGRGADLRLGLLADAARLAERARHRGGIHSGELGDVVDRRRTAPAFDPGRELRGQFLHRDSCRRFVSAHARPSIQVQSARSRRPARRWRSRCPPRPAPSGSSVSSCERSRAGGMKWPSRRRGSGRQKLRRAGEVHEHDLGRCGTEPVTVRPLQRRARDDRRVGPGERQRRRRRATATGRRRRAACRPPSWRHWRRVQVVGIDEARTDRLGDAGRRPTSCPTPRHP